MTVPDSAKARGVVPKRQRADSVIRNPDANGWFVFIDLAESVDAAAAAEFLRWLHSEGEILRSLRDPRTNRRRATLAIAVGPTFFRSANGTLRVSLQARARSPAHCRPGTPASRATWLMAQ